MGRVSLLVEANTSTAIGNISKLGEAIKNAMAKFDSKALTTWETDAETKINKVGETINKLGETLQTFKNNLKADASFGASKALTEFKRKFEDSFKTLDNFKTYFKEGYTFGATTQVETLKTKIAEAKEAIGALNAEVQKQATTGANQTAKAKKDEITKLIAASKELNKQLEKKPVLGARQAVVDFEAGLKTFSQNVAQNIAPALVSLNLVKTQMQELTQVLNSVQQPTWVEPFKAKMQEVVKVLQDIATAYKSVKTEIKQPVGESAARREFQMTDKQAQNLYRTTKMFYRHIRQEFKETRAAATETAKAIREAMAAVQGGGTGAGGTGTATAGTRLGFGEQLWSRMRSNLYSYLTMWFGVAGAIRAANALVEEHNQYLEKGRQYNQTEYEALGELNLKSGNNPEYEKAARRLAAQGFGSTKDAFQFASSAAMANLSVSEMEEIAPIFKYNLAAGGDQRALMSAISYIKSTYGDKYTTKEIAAMILEANSNNPSNIAPTANAIQNLLESYGGMGIPLPDLIAMFTVGSERNKDARIGTMFRAFGTAMRTKGLEAMAIGDVMTERGVAGYEYYKDEKTGSYKFKDAELQKQLESGELAVTMETLTHWAKGKGREIVKDIGANLRTWGGAQLLADIAAKPEEYNRILAELEAISKGDMSKLEETLKRTSLSLGVAVTSTEKAIESTTEQKAASESAFLDSVRQVRKEYNTQYPALVRPWRWFQKIGELWGGADYITTRQSVIGNASSYLEAIENDNGIKEESKTNAREAFINTLRSAAELYGRDNNIDTRTPEGVKKAFELMSSDWRSYAHTRAEEYGWINYFQEAQSRSIQAVTAPESRTPTAAAGAIKAAAAGVKYVNQDEEEKEKAKAEKAEAKAAKAEAKAEKDKAKADAKAEWDSIMGTAVKPQKNIFLQDVFGVASSDMDSNLQAVKGAALNDKWSIGKTGGILGQAFYAYASDKTNAATDKKIIEQLVATLNQGGMSIDDMGNLVVKYVNSVGKQTDSEEARKTLLTFMKEVTGYLKNISDGSDVLQTPITNEAKPRAVPSTARR